MVSIVPTAVRAVLIGVALPFLGVGIYHRLRAAQSREKLHRTREGWPTHIGLRVAGLATFGSMVAWLWNPLWFAWASMPVPEWARWIGAGEFALSIAWLIWMFVSLGPNLTDAVGDAAECLFPSNAARIVA